MDNFNNQTFRHRNFLSRLIAKIWLAGKNHPEAAVVTVLILITGGIFVHSLSRSSNLDLKTATTLTSPTVMPTAIPTDIIPTQPETDSNPSAATTNLVQTSTDPIIDCIGPDGKHLSVTQEQCNSFNSAWVTPTPSPTPTSEVTSTPDDTPTPTPIDTPTDTPNDTPTPTPS